jgi:hypothetical protein
VELAAAPQPLTAAPDGDDIATALAGYADLLGCSPWAGASLVVLRDVVPVPEPWAVVDATGAALPLRGSGHEVLLALSGGHPLTLAGEWDGYAFAPRTAWAEGRRVALAPGGSDE